MFGWNEMKTLYADVRSNSERLDHLETTPRADIDTELLQETIKDYARDLGKLQEEIKHLLGDVDALAQAHKDIVVAVAEGIERVDRSERRIQGTVRRAQKKLADHGFVDEGVEAEADQLQLIDGDRSEEPGVQPVREEVEPADGAPSSIEGVTLAQLRRARGI